MHRSASHGTRGAILLEALVALVVVGTIASGAAWAASESMWAVEHAHRAETHLRAADRLLSAVSLWPRADLDRHLGASAQGPWRLLVERTTRDLYAVRVQDTLSGTIVLRTLLYRVDR